MKHDDLGMPLRKQAIVNWAEEIDEQTTPMPTDPEPPSRMWLLLIGGMIIATASIFWVLLRVIFT